MIDCDTLKTEYNMGYSIFQLSYKYKEPFALVLSKLKFLNTELRQLTDFEVIIPIGRSDKTKIKISKSLKGKNQTPEDIYYRMQRMKGVKRNEYTKRKMSATRQGIKLKSWKGYAKAKPYCEKFNESCRERNREKYNRKCFICGKNEVKNGKRLSVHHVNRLKGQGCNDIDWSLVPLCVKHHATCHNDLWEARINYLLIHVWG